MSTSARTSSSSVRKLTKHGRRPTLPSTVAGATQTRVSSWSVRTSSALAAFRSLGGAEVPERDDRERRRAAERLELVVLEHELVEQPRLAQVVLDRDAEGLGAVGAEREPELERPERAGVLERDVDHVAGALVRDVRLLVGERLDQVVAVADEEHAARLRQVEPLVRVERDRVGAVEAGEEMAGRRRRGSGQPVGAVHVQPDAQPRRTRRRARRSDRRRR